MQTTENRWLPIATAPKDGTEILTVVQGFPPGIHKWLEIDGVSRWSLDPETFMDEAHFRDYWHCTRYAPTHWMPVPEGP